MYCNSLLAQYSVLKVRFGRDCGLPVRLSRAARLAPAPSCTSEATPLSEASAVRDEAGLVEPGGLEPPTSALQRRRSPN